MQYMFMSGDFVYYKTRRSIELDKNLGDAANIVADLEILIMVKLARYVLSSSECLHKLAHQAALLDCTLAMADVALEHDWNMPQVGVVDVTCTTNG